MAAIVSISLMHQVAENNIVTGRYCKRFYPRECWVGTGADISSDANGALELYREPVTDTIMLAPSYDIDVDTTKAATTRNGVADSVWQEVYDGIGGGTTCLYLHQPDATAGQTDVAPSTAYDAGQAFYIDLWLNSSTAEDYSVTIDFGGIWRVKIGRSGATTLLCKGTPEAEEGDYEIVSGGTITENGASVFGKRHTLSFWPLKRKVLLVKMGIAEEGKDAKTFLC